MLLLLTSPWGCSDRQPLATTDTGQTESCAEDWWSTGQPLMLDFCAGCHSSQLSDSLRFGAPDGVDLETLEGALQHTDRIRARVLEDGDMPPGGGMNTEQLERLSAWLACSAQESNPLPVIPSNQTFALPNEFTVTVTDLVLCSCSLTSCSCSLTCYSCSWTTSMLCWAWKRWCSCSRTSEAAAAAANTCLVPAP